MNVFVRVTMNGVGGMVGQEQMPRLLRPVGPSLGLYLRPGRNDHVVLAQALQERSAGVSGLVFDARLLVRQGELRQEARRRGVEIILDPCGIELSTLGGFARGGIEDLPWASDRPHTPADLRGPGLNRLIDPLVEAVVEHVFTAIVAPTHYLGQEGCDWLPVDRAIIYRLRERLDLAGASDVLIYHRLALPGAKLRDAVSRQALMAAVGDLPVDAVWLRLHPFGTTQSGPIALRGYIAACSELHQLGLPIIAEHTGTVGVALLAFGAVGGIESGITNGERFDVSSLLKQPRPDSRPFAPPPRVYLHDVGSLVTRDQARALFQHRQTKGLFGCQDETCCRRGWTDMIGDPRRHFILRRSGEVTGLSAAPTSVRPGLYMDDFLRPATDLALRASRLEPSFESHRKRLESWRATLSALQRSGYVPSTGTLVPERQRIRRRRGA